MQLQGFCTTTPAEEEVRAPLPPASPTRGAGVGVGRQLDALARLQAGGAVQAAVQGLHRGGVRVRGARKRWEGRQEQEATRSSKKQQQEAAAGGSARRRHPGRSSELADAPAMPALPRLPRGSPLSLPPPLKHPPAGRPGWRRRRWRSGTACLHWWRRRCGRSRRCRAQGSRCPSRGA